LPSGGTRRNSRAWRADDESGRRLEETSEATCRSRSEAGVEAGTAWKIKGKKADSGLGEPARKPDDGIAEGS
jgi:hypothetical protein